MGVQVPHADTAEDARRVAAPVKFGPGVAGGVAAGTHRAAWAPDDGLCARWPLIQSMGFSR